jgi:hypothetical protein
MDGQIKQESKPKSGLGIKPEKPLQNLLMFRLWILVHVSASGTW